MTEPKSFQIIPCGEISPYNVKQPPQKGGSNPIAGASTFSRMMRILKIFSALIQINALDANLNILKPDGTPNEKANLGELLELTQSRQDRLEGLEDFVEQLIKANI